jgi:3-hydroxyacyl-CoA dehydrogenase
VKSNDNVSKIGVIGAGTMGAGIAQVAAQGGIEVLLYDIHDQIIAKAQEKIRYFIGRLATKGRISEQDAQAAINRLSNGN